MVTYRYSPWDSNQELSPVHEEEIVDQMGRINHGRVFYTNSERPGCYVLVDYFASRRRVLS